MITNFTGAYRAVDVEVAEHGGDRVILPNDLWSVLREGYDPAVPLLMKLDNSYFPVYGESAVPFETLAFPSDREFAEAIESGQEQALAVKAEYVKALFPML